MTLRSGGACLRGVSASRGLEDIRCANGFDLGRYRRDPNVFLPLILVLIDEFLMLWYANCDKPDVPEISEELHAPIIVAGVGRYGQIILRVLAASGYRATVLDLDP